MTKTNRRTASKAEANSRKGAVLGILITAAQGNLRCPTNAAIALAVQIHDSAVHRVIQALRYDGTIIVDSSQGANRRVISITGTNWSTSEAAPRVDSVASGFRERDLPAERARRKELDAKNDPYLPSEIERHGMQLAGHRFEDIVFKTHSVTPRFVPTPFPVYSHGVSHGYGR